MPRRLWALPCWLLLLRLQPTFVPQQLRPRPLRLPCRAEARQHKLGDIVEVRCEDDGRWYPAVVEYQNPDGSFMVRFDREGYEYHYPLTAWRLRKIRHYIADLEEGKELQGRVTDTCSNGFFVDVGAEDEGFVPTEKEGPEGILDEVEVGQYVTVRVLSTADNLTLSMNPIRSSGLGGIEAFKGVPPDQPLSATIVQTKSFGAFAKVQSPDGGSPYIGMIHITNMGRGFVNSAEDIVSVGEEVKVFVLGTERDRLSLRLDIEKARVRPNTWLEGRVTKLMPYGAFVLAPATDGRMVTGLLHRFQMADDFFDDVQQKFKVGENITVQLYEDSPGGQAAWTQLPHLLPPEELQPFTGEEFLGGLVQEVLEEGAYILVQPPGGGIAVRGILRRVDASLEPGQSPKDVLAVGDEVQVRVLKVEGGRLRLSMLPELDGFRNISADVWLQGIVKEVTNYGAFVSIQAPNSTKGRCASGLLHKSKLKVDVEGQLEELEVGQEIKVRILQMEGSRISLSRRPLRPDPDVT